MLTEREWQFIVGLALALGISLGYSIATILDALQRL
jgi:hypothetical protein